MTYNQLIFKGFSEIASLLFSGEEICIDTGRCSAFQRFLKAHHPEKFEGVDFRTVGDYTYIRVI